MTKLMKWLRSRYQNLITRYKARYIRDSQVEYWKYFPGTNKTYQVSSHGRYRSLPRIITRRDGVKQHRKGHMMRISKVPNPKGGTYAYMRVNVDCKQLSYRADLIMQICFGKQWRQYCQTSPAH